MLSFKFNSLNSNKLHSGEVRKTLLHIQAITWLFSTNHKLHKIFSKFVFNLINFFLSNVIELQTLLRFWIWEMWSMSSKHCKAIEKRLNLYKSNCWVCFMVMLLSYVLEFIEVYWYIGLESNLNLGQWFS